MSLPDVVRRELGDEDPVTRVHLGGDDELFVTATRTVIYRAEGLLSDESVESYPHDAERLSVSEGRRKATVTLDYGLDGEESFSLPNDAVPEVLHPVVAGVLSAAGITEPGETVERTFRFSELTLVVTNQRLVKHVGTAVWDQEYTEYDYDDVTDLAFEEGSVSTSIVLTVNGRQERFKTPAEEARPVKEALADALLSHYEVDTLSGFRERAAEPDPEPEPEPEPEAAEVDFGGGVDPLGADPPDPDDATTVAEAADPVPGGREAFDAGEPPAAETTGVAGGEEATTAETDGADVAVEADAFADSEFQPATPEDDLAEEVERLRAAVERQEEELARQADLIEQLIEELRRGR